MAAAVTLLNTAVWTTTSGTKTKTATPTLNDLIVVVAGHSGNTSSATVTDNNSDGLGAYTRVASAVCNSSGDTLGIHIRNGLIGSATSTIFSHAPGTTTGGGFAVLRVTGMTKTGATASRQTNKQDNQTTGTPAPVFSSAALTGNACIGGLIISDDPTAMSPPSSWTERCEVGYGSPNRNLETVSIDSGFTGTTVTWGASLSVNFCSLIVELDTTAGDVTVALTGLGMTVAKGAVVANNALPVAGQALAVAQGSVVATLAKAITGQALAVAQGSVLAVGGDVSVALTGLSLSVAKGVLVANTAVAASGQSLAVAQGAVVPANSLAASGQALSVARGTLTPNNALAITGQSLTVAKGTLVPTFSVAASGQSLSVARGTVTADNSLALTGQALTTAKGSVVPTNSVAVSGFGLTVGQGSVTAVAPTTDVTVAIAGLSMSVARGSLVPGATVAVSGQALATAKGSVAPGIEVTAAGVSVAVAAGLPVVRTHIYRSARGGGGTITRTQHSHSFNRVTAGPRRNLRAKGKR